jgi:hypothetical protein
MKQTLTTLAILFALSTQAQKVDSVKHALQVKPVVINTLNKDTLYQVGWSVFGLSRNDTSGANSFVQLYNRNGKKIGELNVPIPYAVTSIWLDDAVIDSFILKFLGLTKR